MLPKQQMGSYVHNLHIFKMAAKKNQSGVLIESKTNKFPINPHQRQIYQQNTF